MASKKDLVVIICAAGRQAGFVVPRLQTKYALRLVVSSENSRLHLQQQYPGIDVVQTDISEPSNCTQVVHDATHVFHVGPSLHPRELEIGINMIDAAVAESERPGNRFRHFIFSSVLNTQLRKMFNHDRKRYVEEYLFESPLQYTVLNPGDFLDMAFPVRLFAGMSKPEYHCPMGLKSRSAFVVLEDYAEAVEKVLDEGVQHYGAQYQMCSTSNVAYGVVAEEMAKQIEAKTGKVVPVSEQGYEEAVDFLCTRLFGGVETATSRQRDGAERLILFYRRRGLQGNPNVMQWLLGRKPTGYKEWIARELEKAS